jgi:predicted phage terminase large subunit-like protein
MAEPSITIRPQPLQERILACPADILISGGSAGCGKTWSSVVECLRHVDNPGFRAVIFRRTSPELMGAGSIWEESRRLYPAFGARARMSPTLDWTFPGGATVELRHLQYAGDAEAHQSKAYALIIFEEITGFEEGQFWFMLSRLRSMSGVAGYVRGTCNPDPDSFVARLIAWWIGEDGYPIAERSGVLRWFVRDGDVLDWGDSRGEVEARHPEMPPGSAMSLTFIGGRLEDNAALMRADPGYAARLAALPRVLCERLREGNWHVRAAAGMYFKRANFGVVDELPAPVVSVIRFWDRAATEATAESPDPDWTVGTKMAKLTNGSYAVLHVERFRGTVGTVERRMKNTAQQDGRAVRVGVFRDPGSAGKTEEHHVRGLLDGFALTVVPATQAKELAAGPFSAAVEGGRVVLMRGDWNEAYLAEHEAFPSKAHDDQVDSSSGGYNALQEQVELAHA